MNFVLSSVIIFISTFGNFVNAADYDVEVLPEVCDCRDWYGGCRVNGEKWIDDDVWLYSCESDLSKNATFIGCKSENGTEIKSGKNQTIDYLWHSCEVDNIRQKFSIEPHCSGKNGKKYRVGEEYRDGTFQWLCLSTGRWITGCYYFNETQTDLLLRVGEHAFNGLIEHVCDKRQEYPAIVQYYTQVRKDVDVKHPKNKGTNKNFPEPLQSLIDEDKNVRWLHNSAEYFIKNEEKPLNYIRYLPASRKPL